MDLVLEELNKSLKYFNRQLRENLDKIKKNEEANEMLKEKIEVDKQTILEIEKVIGLIAGKQD